MILPVKNPQSLLEIINCIDHIAVVVGVNWFFIEAEIDWNSTSLLLDCARAPASWAELLHLARDPKHKFERKLTQLATTKTPFYKFIINTVSWAQGVASSRFYDIQLIYTTILKMLLTVPKCDSNLFSILTMTTVKNKWIFTKTCFSVSFNDTTVWYTIQPNWKMSFQVGALKLYDTYTWEE